MNTENRSQVALMTVQEKVFARMQRAHVLKDGRVLIALLAAVETALVVPV